MPDKFLLNNLLRNRIGISARPTASPLEASGTKKAPKSFQAVLEKLALQNRVSTPADLPAEEESDDGED